jgi:hypothetical protein
MRFVQAVNYTPVASRSIDLLVIHDMEAPEGPLTAESVANYFAHQRKGTSGSSAHYNIDNNSVVQSVKDHDVSWAAPGANHDGLHFEHAGYARQTREQWLDAYSRKMLFEISAPLIADKAKEYHIPPVFLRAPELVAQKRGVTTHLEITKAFSHGIGHTDPGTSFPLERFMTVVAKEFGTATPVRHVKAPMPVLKLGAKGHNVRILQRLLNFEEKRAWDDIRVDGVFGTRTQRELKEFQKRIGLHPDGIAGAHTWAALWAIRYKN